jgi:hypothetical protein
MITSLTRKMLIAVFLVFLAGTGMAQRFHGGVMLGGDVSQVAGDNWQGYHKLGVLGGLYSALDLSDHFALQLEFDYIQKGSRKNADVAAQDYQSYLLRMSYFEVPLVFQYTFLKKIQVEIGPAMDVLMGSYEESDGLEVQNTVALRPVTLCGILGASYFFWEKRMKVNFRWNTSILSIREPVENIPDDYRYRFGQWGQFNDVLSLAVYYQFK